MKSYLLEVDTSTYVVSAWKLEVVVVVVVVVEYYVVVCKCRLQEENTDQNRV